MDKRELVLIRKTDFSKNPIIKTGFVELYGEENYAIIEKCMLDGMAGLHLAYGGIKDIIYGVHDLVNRCIITELRGEYIDQIREKMKKAGYEYGYGLQLLINMFVLKRTLTSAIDHAGMYELIKNTVLPMTPHRLDSPETLAIETELSMDMLFRNYEKYFLEEDGSYTDEDAVNNIYRIAKNTSQLAGEFFERFALVISEPKVDQWKRFENLAFSDQEDEEINSGKPIVVIDNKFVNQMAPYYYMTKITVSEAKELIEGMQGIMDRLLEIQVIVNDLTGATPPEPELNESEFVDNEFDPGAQIINESLYGEHKSTGRRN